MSLHRESKLQPVAMGGPGLLDNGSVLRIFSSTFLSGLKFLPLKNSFLTAELIKVVFDLIHFAINPKFTTKTEQATVIT